jgi:UDP-N-acetylglucosamine--N-acetylmuramyl-(pentapeptide) pyrophosphoryl-undecaprenol N-acetylglucosamine transferase
MPSKLKPRILISAGGTGGHILPARAIVETIQDRAAVLYLEKKILSSPKDLFKVFRGFLQSLGIIFRFRPQVVLVTGGYPAVPIGVAAAVCRVPLVLQEQNVFLGKTNRFLARFAKTIVYETPVRPEILHVIDESPFPFRDTVLIFGGSQGAASINQVVQQINWRGLKVVHLTGPGKTPPLPEACDHYEQLAYTDDMAALYRRTCLALCRAGGSTLAELAVCGIPAVLIPYPYAAENHQEANARVYVNAGAAVLGRTEDPVELESLIRGLMLSKSALAEMSACMLDCARPQANENLWEKLKKLI